MERLLTPAVADQLREAFRRQSFSDPSLPEAWRQHPLLSSTLHAGQAPFARMVFDFAAEEYILIDEGIAAVTGFSAEEHRRGGLSFFISRYAPESAPVSAQIVAEMMQTIARLTPAQRAKSHASAVHQFKMANDRFGWILSQSVPLLFDPVTGALRLSLSYMSAITPLYFLNRPSGSVTFASGFDTTGAVTAYTTLELPLRQPQPGIELSRRETDVLRQIVAGKTSKEIAEQLGLAAPTVNTHRKNLLIKARCRNTAELVRFAMSHGLV